MEPFRLVLGHSSVGVYRGDIGPGGAHGLLKICHGLRAQILKSEGPSVFPINVPSESNFKSVCRP